MIELRPYQRDLLHQVQTALAADTKTRVMMQLPTGGGKTIIAGALLADWLKDGRKAVWLTHREDRQRFYSSASNRCLKASRLGTCMAARCNCLRRCTSSMASMRLANRCTSSG